MADVLPQTIKVDVLEELGIPEEARAIFRTVEKRLSFALTAEHLGLTEQRTRTQFYRTCLLLQKDPRGRERIRDLMERMAKV